MSGMDAGEGRPVPLRETSSELEDAAALALSRSGPIRTTRDWLRSLRNTTADGRCVEAFGYAVCGLRRRCCGTLESISTANLIGSVVQEFGKCGKTESRCGLDCSRRRQEIHRCVLTMYVAARTTEQGRRPSLFTFFVNF